MKIYKKIVPVTFAFMALFYGRLPAPDLYQFPVVMNFPMFQPAIFGVPLFYSYSASSLQSATYGAANAFDNNTATRWSSGSRRN